MCACATTLCQNDCTCVPVIQDDPARIIFRTGKPDLLKLHGRLFPSTPLDAPFSNIRMTLSNAAGVIWEGFLQPGDCAPNRLETRCKFKDRGAAKGQPIRDGISLFKLRNSKTNGAVLFQMKAFSDDLAAATDPIMTFEVQIGDDRFATHGVWSPRQNGWIFIF